ncbi:MAG: MerR family transcriptional regulator [Spirochaetota bacterium]
MPGPVLRTAQIARECGIHVNTVRFYERVGLISPVARDDRDYRAFSPRHRYQVKVLRLLYAGEWPGRAVRAGANAVVDRMKAWDLAGARQALEDYTRILDRELENARRAVELLGEWGRVDEQAQDDRRYEMDEVAAALSVTREALRNWERNNLVSIPRRGPNCERYVTARVLARLRVIAVLRKSGHSIAVIHHALSRLRSGGPEHAKAAFSDPDGLEILSAGDHYLHVLHCHRDRVDALRDVLDEIPAGI